MVKLFLGNRAGVLALLPLLIFGYLMLNEQTGYYLYDSKNNLGIWGDVPSINSQFARILASIIVSFNAFAINWIYNSNEFLERNSYISALLYLVLMSFYHSFYSLDGLLLAHTFLIAMLYQLFKLRQNEDGRRHIFNAAFFSGLAASFHPPMIVILPFFLFMVYTIRPFVFREMLLAIIGFGIPLLYGGLYLYYSGHIIDLKLINQSSDYFKKQNDFLIMSVLFTLLFVLSLITLRDKMQKSSSRLKKLISILWWMVLIGVLFGFMDFFVFGQIERFSFLMIPLSFFLSYSFKNKTFGGFAIVLYYLTFIYSLVNFFL